MGTTTEVFGKQNLNQIHNRGNYESRESTRIEKGRSTAEDAESAE